MQAGCRIIQLLKYDQPTILPNFPKLMLAIPSKKDYKEFWMLLVASENKDPFNPWENTFWDSLQSARIEKAISTKEGLIKINRFFQTRIMFFAKDFDMSLARNTNICRSKQFEEDMA